MNKFVKQQLERCRISLPSWNEDTTQLIIPKYLTQQINSSNEFTIEIKNYILNEPPNFTLSHDWNNDTVPPETHMYVVYVDTKGKMTKVQGRGVTTNIPWVGWLPNKSFEVI